MPKTLLLQGPVGPFFAGLAKELRQRGDTVKHVIFNGGDRLFADRRARVDYRGKPEDVGAWILARCQEWQIDRVILFGDCRPYHQAAQKLLRQHHIPVWVFEEGYLRPVFLTFERHGVNAHTLLPRDPEFYTSGPDVPAMPQLRNFHHVFLRRIVTCMAYYIAIFLDRRRYPHYQHYRGSHLWREGLQWLRAGWRKLLYRRPDNRRFRQFHDQPFYLLPLQVRGDSQICTHSRYGGMEEVIAHTIRAFSHDAPRDSHLVIKHHPMDRGYTDYRAWIEQAAAHWGVADRVWYVHDCSLPNLLQACRGVITVNSTVGLSAIHHQKPVLVLGAAMYRVPGLSFPGTWQEFWTTDFKPDSKLVRRFVDYLRYWTQMNACSATSVANFSLLDRLPEFRTRAATAKLPVQAPIAASATSSVLPQSMRIQTNSDRSSTTTSQQEVAFAG